MIYERKQGQPGCGPTIGKVQAILKERKQQGAATDELMPLIGVTLGHLSTALSFALAAGLLEWYPEPLGRCWNRRRWYAAGFKPAQRPTPPARSKLVAPRRDYMDARYHVELPDGYVSPLNPADCRPWAEAAVGA